MVGWFQKGAVGRLCSRRWFALVVIYLRFATQPSLRVVVGALHRLLWIPMAWDRDWRNRSWPCNRFAFWRTFRAESMFVSTNRSGWTIPSIFRPIRLHLSSCTNGLILKHSSHMSRNSLMSSLSSDGVRPVTTTLVFLCSLLASFVWTAASTGFPPFSVFVGQVTVVDVSALYLMSSLANASCWTRRVVKTFFSFAFSRSSDAVTVATRRSTRASIALMTCSSSDAVTVATRRSTRASIALMTCSSSDAVTVATRRSTRASIALMTCYCGYSSLNKSLDRFDDMFVFERK